MIDKEVIRIAEERVQLEIDEQNKSLLIEIGRIKSESAARGVLRSGATLNLITNACALVIKNRAQLIWQTFFRFLTTTGISYSETLAEELKVQIVKHLPENLMKDIVNQSANLVRSPNSSTQVEVELDLARRAALAKVGTEIDLFVHSLKKNLEMKEKETSSTIFNIYSPVGAIQTGDSSIANIAQTIDSEVREQLSKVLGEISLRLSQSEFAMPYPKGEIIEIVQEGQEELKKQSPNITKLRGMLSTVGTAIQTIASMKPAYETLKQALTFLGISLP
jgi:hypothetical protein